MKSPNQDPKLTAFALGELQGQDAEEMQRFVESNPEAKAYVEEIQATALLVKMELNQPSNIQLKPAAEERLRNLGRDQRTTSARKTTSTNSHSWSFYASSIAAAAAAVALIVTLKNQNFFADDSAQMQHVATAPTAQPSPSPSHVPIAPDPASTVAAEPPSTVAAAPPSTVAAEPQMPSSTVAPSGGPSAGAPSKPGAASSVTVAANKSANEVAADGAYSFDQEMAKVATTDSTEEIALETALAPAPKDQIGGQPGKFTQSVSMNKKLVTAQGGQGSFAQKGGLYAKTSSFGGPPRGEQGAFNTETYSNYKANEILNVADHPLSTFSIDVDTASYSNVRRYLVQSALPPADAVRTEELVNYFAYDYAGPTDGKPFATHVEIADSPWNKEAKLLRVALKGKEVSAAARPASNLVFLIDVSGSMDEPSKLPLVQRSLNMLVESLRAKDRVALVTYAGNTSVVLPSTRGDQKEKIYKAILQLGADGSTNGGAGIQLAYEAATKNFIQGGINRVILASDGDFNVGVTSEGELIRLIEEKAKSGVFLSVLGFGMGNLKDSTMQKLANKGNGNYAYIDSLREAKKTLIEQAGGTLQTIAKDVKIQVEFNPAHVSKYRLIGYEKRMLANQDFNDDKKDAGEIGAGHTITAFYEVYPAKGKNESAVDPLKYQQPAKPLEASPEKNLATTTGKSIHDEIATVKLRYKKPEGTKSELIVIPVVNSNKKFETTSSDFQFAASVIKFSEVLKLTPVSVLSDKTETPKDREQARADLAKVLEIASKHTYYQGMENTYRTEFVELVKKAQFLKK